MNAPAREYPPESATAAPQGPPGPDVGERTSTAPQALNTPLRTPEELDAELIHGCKYLGALAAAAELTGKPEMEAIGRTVEGLRRLLRERAARNNEGAP